jgi:hypothetical protein
MGGGGDMPDVPDYSEVITMLKDTFKVSSQRAQEMWDWGKKAYETNSGIGKKGIANALKQMNFLSDQAQKFSDDYWKTYNPAEHKQLENALQMGTPGQVEKERAKAQQDVALKVKAAREAAKDRLRSLGLAPSAIEGSAELATRVSEAGMQSAAGNAAADAQEKAARDALAQALQIGQANAGRINPAAAGSLAAGGQAASIGPAIDTAHAQVMGTPSTWAQIGTGAATNVANVQGMGFDQAMKKYEAEQAQSDPFGELLGTILPIGMKAFGVPGFDDGGAIPEPGYTQMFAAGGGPIPIEASPTGGAVTDDIPAEINGSDGGVLPAQLNAGEFVMPQDVVKWVGEKGMQQFILKSRKEMGDPNAAPAQPEMAGGPPPPTMDGAGIPPLPAGVA